MNTSTLYRKLLRSARQTDLVWEGHTDLIVRGIFGVSVTTEMLRAAFDIPAGAPISSVELSRRWMRARARHAAPFGSVATLLPPLAAGAHVNSVFWAIRGFSVMREWHARATADPELHLTWTLRPKHGEPCLPDISVPREKASDYSYSHTSSFPLARDLLCIVAAATKPNAVAADAALTAFLARAGPCEHVSASSPLAVVPPFQPKPEFVFSTSVWVLPEGTVVKDGTMSQSFPFRVRFHDVTPQGAQGVVSIQLRACHWMFVDAMNLEVVEVADPFDPAKDSGPTQSPTSQVTTKDRQGYLMGKLVVLCVTRAGRFDSREAVVGPIALNAGAR